MSTLRRRAALVAVVVLALAAAAWAAPAPRIVDVSTFAGPAPRLLMLRTRDGWLLEARNPSPDRSTCPCVTISVPKGYVTEITIAEIIIWPPPLAYIGDVEVGRGLPIAMRTARLMTVTAGPNPTEIGFAIGDVEAGHSILVAQITLRRSR
jgi:hypothetical protein